MPIAEREYAETPMEDRTTRSKRKPPDSMKERPPPRSPRRLNQAIKAWALRTLVTLLRVPARIQQRKRLETMLAKTLTSAKLEKLTDAPFGNSRHIADKAWTLLANAGSTIDDEATVVEEDSFPDNKYYWEFGDFKDSLPQINQVVSSLRMLQRVQERSNARDAPDQFPDDDFVLQQVALRLEK